MRIDHDHDPEARKAHLRVGRLLVSVAPDRAGHRPGLHDCTSGLDGFDPAKAAEVAKLAEAMIADTLTAPHVPANGVWGGDDRGRIVPDRVLDGLGFALTDWHLSYVGWRFGGVCWPWRGRLWTVALQDSGPLGVDRWKPKAIERRIRSRARRWLGIVDVPMGAGGAGGNGVVNVGVSGMASHTGGGRGGVR